MWFKSFYGKLTQFNRMYAENMGRRFGQRKSKDKQLFTVLPSKLPFIILMIYANGERRSYSLLPLSHRQPLKPAKNAKWDRIGV